MMAKVLVIGAGATVQKVLAKSGCEVVLAGSGIVSRVETISLITEIQPLFEPLQPWINPQPYLKRKKGRAR